MTIDTTRRAVLRLAAAAVLPPGVGAAQAYPSRPIRLLHGFGPGSSIDVVARLIAQKLSEALSLPVVVDGRSGATGTIANQAVVSSAADGHSLLIAPLAAVVTASHLYPVKYNALKDLAPVAQVAFFDAVLVAGPSLVAGNVKELIGLAKSRAEPISYASPGAGTGFHIAGEMLAQMAGVKLLHVPYKGGGAAAFTDLLAGRVDMSFESLGTVLPHVQAGRLRSLAVTGSACSPSLPEVPTVAETVPGYQRTGWHGIFAPAATPAPVVQRLHTALLAIMATPEMQQRWTTMNLRFNPMTPEAFGRQIAADDQRYGKIIQERGIKVD